MKSSCCDMSYGYLFHRLQKSSIYFQYAKLPILYCCHYCQNTFCAQFHLLYYGLALACGHQYYCVAYSAIRHLPYAHSEGEHRNYYADGRLQHPVCDHPADEQPVAYVHRFCDLRQVSFLMAHPLLLAKVFCCCL